MKQSERDRERERERRERQRDSGEGGKCVGCVCVFAGMSGVYVWVGGWGLGGDE